MARAFDIGWNRLFVVPELRLLQKWKKNGSALHLNNLTEKLDITTRAASYNVTTQIGRQQ